ncbi:MAG: Sua5/YciO/YrdC/YwlC family protein, partial [Phycisphaerae bacterium]|nr:Sua5/YciO/YrdC/YwlC family protein [Phycisphaerae bacterium]
AGPLAGPSANRSNHVSPTTADHVRADLGDQVDLILDGGPCRVGIESTVIDLSGTVPTILRPGGVAREQIETIIGPVAMFSGSVDSARSATSPGQQSTHYAPRTRAVRCTHCAKKAGRVILRWPSSDPEECARIFYAELRQLDQMNADEIAIELPPDEPRWAALRDRIIRATAANG